MDFTKRGLFYKNSGIFYNFHVRVVYETLKRDPRHECISLLIEISTRNLEDGFHGIVSITTVHHAVIDIIFFCISFGNTFS